MSNSTTHGPKTRNNQPCQWQRILNQYVNTTVVSNWSSTEFYDTFWVLSAFWMQFMIKLFIYNVQYFSECKPQLLHHVQHILLYILNQIQKMISWASNEEKKSIDIVILNVLQKQCISVVSKSLWKVIVYDHNWLVYIQKHNNKISILFYCCCCLSRLIISTLTQLMFLWAIINCTKRRRLINLFDRHELTTDFCIKLPRWRGVMVSYVTVFLSKCWTATGCWGIVDELVGFSGIDWK